MNNPPNTLPPTDEVAELRACPKRGEIRIMDGKVYRFIERELEGDKWEVLGDAPARPAPTDVELERYAALGRACERHGLGWYNEDGEMRFQAPDDVIAEQAVEQYIAALRAPAVPREVEVMRQALVAARAQIVTLYTSIARGDPEAGERFALGEPAVQQIDAALRASPTPAGGDGKQGRSVSRDQPCGDAQEHCPQASETTGKDD